MTNEADNNALSEVLDDRDVSTALEGLIERKIRTTPVAPLMGRALDVAMEGGHHQRLLDAVLTGLAGFLDDNRTTFRTRLEQESPWWIPEPVDDRIFEKIYQGANAKAKAGCSVEPAACAPTRNWGPKAKS